MKYLITFVSLTFLAQSMAFAVAKPGPFKKVSDADMAKTVEAGKTSFTTNCVVCHGDKGDGNGPAGAAMNPKPRNLMGDWKDFKNLAKAKGKSDPSSLAEAVYDTVTNGLKGTSMAGYAHLKDEERIALSYFVTTFKKK